MHPTRLSPLTPLPLLAAALLGAIGFVFPTTSRAAAPLAVNAVEPPPAAIELWPGRAPDATGDSDEDKPALYAYLPDPAQNTGAAILVCPGGGFMTRCTDYEGVLIAQWFKAHGIAAFVLRYRIQPIYAQAVSLLDAQRGLQYLRAHAAEFHLAPGRVGIIGFSAGATLACATATQSLPTPPDATDAVARQPSRPDFVVLAYGSATPRDAEAADNPATHFPPTFMFCTAEDTGSITNMITLYAALRRQRVPAEAHFFVNGEHGTGFAQGDPVLGEWPGLMLNWIRAGGWLTGEARVAVRGTVRVDGVALPRGSVILTPLDAGPGAPSATGYVMNTGPVDGEFVIPPAQGLVPGRYRVEVRQDAVRWLSNARNPIMVTMGQKQRDGTLTDADRQEWFAYARQRDLAPAIDNQRVFRRQRPAAAEDFIVEIKAGAENHLALEVFSR